jgi:hypothetical protein
LIRFDRCHIHSIPAASTSLLLLVFSTKTFLTKLSGRKSETIHFSYLQDSGSPGVQSFQDMGNQDTIKICTYNVVNGHNGCLTFALTSMKAMGISLGILTETKLIDDTYPTTAHGYTVVATSAKSHHQGGLALFHQTDAKSFTLEGTSAFGPNVIRTTLVSGQRRWTVLGV